MMTSTNKRLHGLNNGENCVIIERDHTIHTKVKMVGATILRLPYTTIFLCGCSVLHM